jgi:hypothetical protein
LAAIVGPLWFRTPSVHHVILPLVLLGFYVYGTPILTYEIPRFQDIFIHGAGVMPIINEGIIDPTHRYASEHPTAFVLMAMSVITQNMEIFMYFRFIELFIMLLSIVLIYFIARFFSPKYAQFGPLAFIGVFWVDQGHFSPQGIALILYLVFFLCMIKALNTRGNRNWLILAMLMLLTINLTSPTNSFFLLLNLLTIPALGYVITRQTKYASKYMILALICGVVFIGWSTYNAESRTILKAEVFGDEIAEKIGSVEGGVEIHRTPNSSYVFVNNIRMLVISTVIGSGIVLSIVLMRNKLRSDHSIMLVGWFAIAYLIIVSFYISSFLLSRHFMYTIFPWALLVPFFLANMKHNRWQKSIKLFLLFSIVAFTILVPITRYGREPTTYVPASLVNSGELIAENSDNGNVIAYGMSASITKYLNAVFGGDVEVRRYHLFFEKVFEEDRTYRVEDWIKREATSADDKIIFSDTEKNIIGLKYSEGKLYETFENNVQSSDNLVINNGDARVYSRIR